MEGARSVSGGRLRMAELVRRTGVAAQTIRYYVNEGLLPKPRKSARNMAWYSEQHVALIRQIRTLQQEHFMPLRAIRALLHESDEYPLSDHQRRLLAELRQRMEADGAQAGASSQSHEAGDYGLSREECDELRSHGLLSEGGDARDAQILRLCAQMRDAGLTPARGIAPRDLAVVHDIVDLLFDHQLRIFSERLRDLTPAEFEIMRQRAVPAFIELIALLNERRIDRFVSRFN